MQRARQWFVVETRRDLASARVSCVRASRSGSSDPAASSRPKNESSAVRLPSTSSSSEKIEVPEPDLAGAEPQEQRARQLHRRGGVRVRVALPVVQHGVLEVQHVRLADVGEDEVERDRLLPSPPSGRRGAWPSRRRRDRAGCARGCRRRSGCRARRSGRAVAQLVRAGQVDGAPDAALGLVAELVVGRARAARAPRRPPGRRTRGGRAASRPSGSRRASIAALRLLLHGGGAAHRLDVLRAERLGRQRIEVRRVAVVPAEVELVDRLRVVAQRAVVAAVREAPARAAAAARAARRSRAASRPGSRAAASGRGCSGRCRAGPSGTRRARSCPKIGQVWLVKTTSMSAKRWIASSM